MFEICIISRGALRSNPSDDGSPVQLETLFFLQNYLELAWEGFWGSTGVKFPMFFSVITLEAADFLFSP